MHNNSSAIAMLLRRCAAFLYDALLLIAVFFIVTSASIAFNDGEAITHPAYRFVLLAVAFAFYSWFWMHGGQTLGMKAWRLRLVAENGQQIRLAQCAVRFLCGALLFGLTYLSMGFDDRQRALHDHLSRTIIVKTNK